MSIIDALGAPICQRLSLALIHFLWQGVLIGGVVYVAMSWTAKWRPQARYLLSLAGLLAMVTAPAVTLCLLPLPTTERTAAPPAELASSTPPANRPNFVDTPLPTAELSTNSEKPIVVGQLEAISVPHAKSEPPPAVVASRLSPFAVVESLQPYALILWMGGVTLLSGRLMLGAWAVHCMKRHLSPIPSELAAQVAPLARRLGLSASRVHVSKHLHEAMVLGIWRPLVILPASWILEMPTDVLEAIIAHELAHIRRLDPWTNLLQRLVETLLFYHPAVWWLSQRVSLEREMCADTLAVTTTGCPLDYANALEHLGRRNVRKSPPPLATAFGGNKMALFHRVRNVLGLTPSHLRATWWPLGIAALLVPVLICGVVATAHWSGSDATAAEPDGDGAEAAEGDTVPGGPFDHLIYMRHNVVDGSAKTDSLMLAEITSESFEQREVYTKRNLHGGWKPLATIGGKLYAESMSTLIVVDLASGEVETIERSIGSTAVDGGRIYTIVPRGEDKPVLRAFDLASESVRAVCELEDRITWSGSRKMLVSPDGKRLAFFQGLGQFLAPVENQLTVVDLENGRVEKVGEPVDSATFMGGGGDHSPGPPFVWLNNKTLLFVRDDVKRDEQGQPTLWYGSNKTLLTTVDVTTGKQTDLPQLPKFERRHDMPSFAPQQAGLPPRIVLGDLGQYAIDLKAKKLVEDSRIAGTIEWQRGPSPQQVLAGDRVLHQSEDIPLVAASPDGQRVVWFPDYYKKQINYFDLDDQRERVLAEGWFPDCWDSYAHVNQGTFVWITAEQLSEKPLTEPPEGWTRFSTGVYPPAPDGPAYKDERLDVADYLSLSIATETSQVYFHDRVKVTVTVRNTSDQDIEMDRAKHGGFVNSLRMQMDGPRVSGMLDGFESASKPLSEDPITMKAGASIEVSKLVETDAVGTFTLKGIFLGQGENWKGRVDAEPVTFEVIHSDNDAERLRNKFDRLIAKCRAEYANDPATCNYFRILDLEEAAVPLLIDELRSSDNAGYRKRMGYALERLANADALPYFRNVLEGKLNHDSQIVLDGLMTMVKQDRSRDQALGLLIGALDHEKVGVRRGAAERLAKVYDPRLREAFAPAVNDSDGQVATTAARYLAAYDFETLADWLDDAIRSRRKDEYVTTKAHYLATRTIIAELENRWHTTKGEVPDKPWDELQRDKESLETLRQTLMNWRQWAGQNERASTHFFDEDRKEWPAERAKPDNASIEPSNDAKEIITRIKQLGGWVDYQDGQLTTVYLGNHANDQLLSLLPSLKGFKRLNLETASGLTDEGLKHLSSLMDLEYLSLYQTGMTDEKLKYIAPLVKLKELQLAANRISDDGLRHLAGLRNIETLHLEQTLSADADMRITNAGLRQLSELKNLRVLVVHGTDVTFDGLLKIPHEKLDWIQFSDGQIDDNGMARLDEFSSLTGLTLMFTSVTDEGLASLKLLPKLERLGLHGHNISDEGLSSLATLKNLEYLEIRCGLLKGQGLSVLEHTPRLKRLQLFSNSAEALVALEKAKSLEELTLYNATLGDEKLSALARLGHLDRLVLFQCQISEQQYQQLRRAIPKTNVIRSGGNTLHGDEGPFDSAESEKASATAIDRKQLIGTWLGGGLFPLKLVLRENGEFEQSPYSPTDREQPKATVSGTWKLEGDKLTRVIRKSNDEDRIGEKSVTKIESLETDELRFRSDDGSRASYQRAKDFHGWLLLQKYAETKSSRLPDLWEERPPGSKSYEIRKDVKFIYQDINGSVFYRADKNVFYIQSDPGGSSTLTYYGPYRGDPRVLLSLPKDEQAEEDDNEPLGVNSANKRRRLNIEALTSEYKVTYGEDASPETIKQHYTKLAIKIAQTGGDGGSLEKVVRRALAFEQDLETETQLKIYLGDSLWRQTPSYAANDWRPWRRRAAEVYMGALASLLSEDLPAEAPELPAVERYRIVGAAEDVLEAAKTRHAEQMAAREQAKRLRELVGFRQTLTGQIVQLYSREPDDFDELQQLVREQLKSEGAASQLIEAAKTYREQPTTQWPVLLSNTESLFQPETSASEAIVESDSNDRRQRRDSARADFLAVERIARMPKAEQADALEQLYRELWPKHSGDATMFLSSSPKYILKRDNHEFSDGADWAEQLADAADKMTPDEVAEKLSDDMWMRIATRLRVIDVLRQNEDAVTKLVGRDLNSAEKSALQRAVTTIATLKMQSLYGPLLDAIVNEPVLSPAHNAAMQCRDPALLPLILTRIEKDPTCLAKFAGMLQALIYREPVPPVLERHLANDDSATRTAAIWAVVECRDEKLADLVVELAGADDEEMRWRSAYMAGHLPSEAYKSVRAELLPLLSDTQDRVRFQAVKSLAEQKELESGAAILSALVWNEIPEQGKVSTMQSMTALAGRTFGYEMHQWGTSTPGNCDAIQKLQEWLAQQRAATAQEGDVDADVGEPIASSTQQIGVFSTDDATGEQTARTPEHSQDNPRKVTIPDTDEAEAKDNKCVLDLRTGELLALPANADRLGNAGLAQYYIDLGKGDLMYERASGSDALLVLRGSKVYPAFKTPDFYTKKVELAAGYTAYILKPGEQKLRIMTPNRDSYHITILRQLGADGLEIEYTRTPATEPEIDTVAGDVPPPVDRFSRQNMIRSNTNLKNLFLGFVTFANDKGGNYPPSIGALVANDVVAPETVIAPWYDTEVPANFDSLAFQDQSDWANHRTGYIFLLAEQKLDGNPNQVALVEVPWDNEMNNLGVCFQDGHIERMPYAEADKKIEAQTGRNLDGWIKHIGRGQRAEVAAPVSGEKTAHEIIVALEADDSLKLRVDGIMMAGHQLLGFAKDKNWDKYDKIVISASPDLPFRVVVQIMTTIKEAGFENVAVGTNKEAELDSSNSEKPEADQYSEARAKLLGFWYLIDGGGEQTALFGVKCEGLCGIHVRADGIMTPIFNGKLDVSRNATYEFAFDGHHIKLERDQVGEDITGVNPIKRTWSLDYHAENSELTITDAPGDRLNETRYSRSLPPGAVFDESQVTPAPANRNADTAPKNHDLSIVPAAFQPPQARPNTPAVKLPGLERPVYRASQFALLTLGNIEQATLQDDGSGNLVLNLRIAPTAAKRLAEHTRNHIGNPLLISIKGTPFSAPIIRSELRESLQVTGYSKADRQSLEWIVQAVKQVSADRKRIIGTWVTKRDNDGDENPDYEVLDLAADGTWTTANLWGTPEQPTKVEVTDRRKGWSLHLSDVTSSATSDANSPIGKPKSSEAVYQLTRSLDENSSLGGGETFFLDDDTLRTISFTSILVSQDSTRVEGAARQALLKAINKTAREDQLE